MLLRPPHQLTQTGVAPLLAADIHFTR